MGQPHAKGAGRALAGVAFVVLVCVAGGSAGGTAGGVIGGDGKAAPAVQAPLCEVEGKVAGDVRLGARSPASPVAPGGREAPVVHALHHRWAAFCRKDDPPNMGLGCRLYEAKREGEACCCYEASGAIAFCGLATSF